MEVRKGFKQTEVGVIPEDWDVKTFQSLAHIERGKFTARPRNDPKYYGGDIPFIQTGDVTNSNGRITEYSQTLNQEGLKVSKLFPKGTLFFTIAANIGDVGFATFDTACPDSLVAITPNKNIDKRWLAHELRKRKSAFESIATHNAQLNINLEKLRPYLLPLPPLAEQEAIAEALSDADALIESLENLLAKKSQVKQGAMSELLSGKKRLPEFDKKQGYKQTPFGVFPKDWEIVPLKEVSSMHGRIGWQGLKQTEFTMNSDEPFLITGMNFKDGEIRWEEVYHISEERYGIAKEIQLKIGDVLMTKDGTIGKILFVDHIPYPGRASLNSHLLVFRPINKRYVPKFMFYQLNYRTFHNHIELEKSGTTFFGITQEAVGKYNAFLPSIAEQTAIVEILSDMDAEIRAVEEKLSKARAVKAGMMSELLTGRTRLV